MSSYKKIKSTIMVPEDTYKETRILAIRRGMDIGSLVDEALREKVVRDYQLMGLQPPFSQTRSQSPSQQHDDTVIHSARYEAAKSGTQSSQKGSLEYSVVLPGLKFPVTKNEILERVKKVKYPEDNQETQETMKITIDILKQLPDDVYTSKNKLEKDYSDILRRKLKYLEGRVVTIIYDELASPEEGQPQQRQTFVQQSDEDYPIIIPTGKNEYLIKLIIPELKFPTTKQKIRQALIDGMEETKQETHPSQQDSVRKILYVMGRNLDIISTLLSFNKTYKDVGQIEEAIVKSSKEKLSELHLKPEGKLIGCKISYGLDILRRQMGMELISQKDK